MNDPVKDIENCQYMVLVLKKLILPSSDSHK